MTCVPLAPAAKLHTKNAPVAYNPVPARVLVCLPLAPSLSHSHYRIPSSWRDNQLSMPFHGLRSRSKSRYKQLQDALTGTLQLATPRPSSDSRASASTLSVNSIDTSSSGSDSRRSRTSSTYGTAQGIPPVPPIPDAFQNRKEAAVALFPFMANLPRFSALPDEDIDLWLAAVEAIANHVGAPPDAPVPLIPLLLRGAAFRRFVKIHNDTRGRLTTWIDWRAHLLLEFRAPNYLADRREELANRSWRTSETLAAYFDQRRTLQMVALPEATEEELVEDMLSGVPIHQRRHVVDAIPHTQRMQPSLAILRRAMVDCEVNQRGRDTLRSDRLGVVHEHRRLHSQSPTGRHSLPAQAPQSSPVIPSTRSARTASRSSSSSPGSTPSSTVRGHGAAGPSRHHRDLAPPPTITVTF